MKRRKSGHENDLEKLEENVNSKLGAMMEQLQDVVCIDDFVGLSESFNNLEKRLSQGLEVLKRNFESTLKDGSGITGLSTSNSPFAFTGEINKRHPINTQNDYIIGILL